MTDKTGSKTLINTGSLPEAGLGKKTEEIKFRHSHVNGIVFLPYMTEQRIHDLTNFQTRSEDVFIVSYPKSGTTWLAQILREIAKPTMPEGMDEQQVIGGTVPFFESVHPTVLDTYPSPRYMCTHLPYSMMPHNSKKKLKYIFIARNPRDVAASFFHWMRVLDKLEWDGSWDEFIGYFLKGNVPYGSYFDHILGWWNHQDDENLIFLKYEDMKKDLLGHVKKIAEFIEVPISQEEAQRVTQACSFSSMKADPKTNYDRYRDKIYKKDSTFSFMRKGVVGDWKNYFSDEQLAEFNKLYASRLEGTGIDFEFIG